MGTLGVLVFLGLATATAGLARAGSISLQLTASAQVEHGRLVVQLAVHNTGDEAAHSVSPTLHFRGQTARGDVRRVLEPGARWEGELAVATDDLRTGRWPYRIVVAYADANAYPFSALHVATLLVGAPPPGKLAVLDTRADPIATTGVLHLRLKNLSPEPRRVTVTVHLPDGIEWAKPLPTLDLAAWEERTVATTLVNRTGLPGSRYAVFVSAEYDDGPVHHATLVPATVDIVVPQSAIERWRVVLWIAAGLLVLIWVAFVGWRVVAGRRRPAERGPRR